MELPPVAVLNDSISPSSSGNNGTEDQDQLFGGSTPASTTPVVDDQLVVPTIDTTDVATLLVPPSVIPTEYVPTISATDLWPHQDPLPQVSLFDTPSPLTPISTLQSHEPQTPTQSSEVGTPTTHPPSTTASHPKRKSTSHGHGMVKKARRGRKSHQGKQQDVPHPEDSHVDPSIWPPIIEDGTQKVSKLLFTPFQPHSSPCWQQYVECDRCAKRFHCGCVGLKADCEDGSPWECPPCVWYVNNLFLQLNSAY